MSLPAHWVELSPGDEAGITDRGFLYGDALFETLRWSPAGYHLLEYHLDRLSEGATRLQFNMDLARVREQLAQGAEYLRAHEISGARARLTVSRGEGGTGYRGGDSPARLALTVSATSLAWGEAASPARLAICQTRLAHQPLLAGMKHANRLEQVLAAREVAEAGADEGLMFDPDGQAVCCVAANLFAVFEDTMLTPTLEHCGVAGTMRRHIIEELAPAAGLGVEVCELQLADLLQARELFMSNALVGIRSVAGFPGVTFRSFASADRLRSLLFASSLSHAG